MNSELQEKLEVACQAVRTAGEFLLQNRFTPLKKYMKNFEENDFATQLDISTEKVIKDILLVKYPDIPIIGEETGLTGKENAKETWFVDPLDGTKAFFQGNVGFTSVSVALTTTQEVLVGAVYNPFTDTLYSATKDSSSTINNHLINKNIFPEKLSDSRFILDFSSKLPLALKKRLLELELENLFSRIFRYEGSIAQHLCFIGSGVHHAGLFWGQNKGHFWDIGAGLLICRQAGLKITDFQGNDITPKSNNFSQIILGSKTAHSELLKVVEDLLPLSVNK
ncbi:MAG: Inositol-1-monophosphatase [Candidatus Heimdallarchaeota archaeon LC_3]|nr:MAG: Inositol-1-monophosphatase [Candidatus Heimdallarchaeota archaeon LC_3]